MFGNNIFDESAPEGLKLLHTARTGAEADMLRQVLTEAGFHIEHVASSLTGVFGMSGNTNVFVASNEFETAGLFVKEYLSAEPVWEDEGEAAE